MRKIISTVIIMIVIALLMGACSSNISQIDNATIVEKVNEHQMENPDCNKRINCNRYVIVEKNDDQIQLTVNNEKIYDVLIEETTVNIQYYNKNFAVKDVEFPNMN